MNGLTERKGKIFDAFMDAFELEAKPDFRSRPPRAVYSGLIYPRDRLSQEELMRMPEYTGFVDGYENKPEKFRGPSDLPDRQEEPGTRPILRLRFFRRKCGRSLTSTSRERYHDGYVKGYAARP